MVRPDAHRPVDKLRRECQLRNEILAFRGDVPCQLRQRAAAGVVELHSLDMAGNAQGGGLCGGNVACRVVAVASGELGVVAAIQGD